MTRYLLDVPDQLAWMLERWAGNVLYIGPRTAPEGVPVAALDAVTDEEAAPVLARLAAGSSLPRHGIPAHRQRGLDPDDTGEPDD